PLYWDQDSGGLLRMAYNRQDISTLYESRGDPLLGRAVDKTFVLTFRDDRLVDETNLYRTHPAHFDHLEQPSTYALSVSQNEVTAGVDDDDLKISSAGSTVVRVSYTIDDGAIQTFTTRLGPDGRASFHVSSGTRKGRYNFTAFNIQGQGGWIRANASLVIR